MHAPRPDKTSNHPDGPKLSRQTALWAIVPAYNDWKVRRDRGHSHPSRRHACDVTKRATGAASRHGYQLCRQEFRARSTKPCQEWTRIVSFDWLHQTRLAGKAHCRPPVQANSSCLSKFNAPMQVAGTCSNACACNKNARSGRWRWYDRYFAYNMAFGMQDYEQEIAACKRRLFMELFQHNIEDLLEVGMGTGPNLKYYKQRQVCHRHLQATSCCSLRTL